MMKLLLGLAFATAMSLSFATDRIVFDQRIANNVRDIGIVIGAGALPEAVLIERLRAFATEQRSIDVARLTIASDVTVLLQGVGLEGAPHWCNLRPFGGPIRNFAQVNFLRGSAVVRLMSDGKPTSIQLSGNGDPFEFKVAGVEARIVSFRVHAGPSDSGSYSMSLYLRPKVLPSPEAGGRMAQALKEVLKPTGGIAVFRTDGFFGCEGGPIKDYFGESDNPFSKAASDAAPYLFCNLDSTPKCQLRSRDQDSAELRKGYERRKAEFIEENERLKKLEGKRE